MFKLISFLLGFILLISCTGNSSESNSQLAHVVTTEWLSQHLNDSDLVLLYAGKEKKFNNEHIPRSLYVSFKSITSENPENDLTMELPSIEELDSVFTSLGVTENSKIVLYWGKKWISPTTRLFFTLDYMGMGDRTYILDGGLSLWKEEMRKVTAESAIAKPGKVISSPDSKLLVDKNWVSSNLNNPEVLLIDSRASSFYAGEMKSNSWNKRPGHIPSAINIPYMTYVNDSTYQFLKSGELKDLFSKHLNGTDKKLVFYCHVGQQATLGYFVAKNLGYDAYLYDGSFQEWARDSTKQVVKSKLKE